MIETLRAIANEVKEAIDAIPDAQEKGRTVSMGADGTPTSGIDKVAESVVIDFISRNKVPLNILSEEIGFVDNGSSDTLVLDPIDGTNNSVAGIPLYTISMAIGTDSLKSIHTAYLRNLVTGDEYTAEKGRGAFLNGKRMSVKQTFDPKRLTMMIYLGRGAVPLAHNLTKRVKSVRTMGCASLEMAYVAQGSVDGYFMSSENYERSMRIVDIAASTLLLREAGGEVYSLDGMPLDMPFDLGHRADFLAVCSKKVYDYVMNENSVLSADTSSLRYGICANMTIPFVVDIARRVMKSLKGCPYVLESDLAEAMDLTGQKISEMDVDVLITIGGDGTILRAMTDTDAAIIGINAGSVGFLTEIGLGNIESSIKRLVKGDYTVQKRARISVVLDGKKVGEALNEVVIHTDSVAKIRRFKVYVNDSLTTDVRSDGILLSTPTGSTSYALSLGGPIMDPRVDAWLMVPMAAFKLSSKQMVIPAFTKVTVESVLDKGCLLVIDGQTEIHLPGGSKVEMTRSQRSASFIVFDTDFYRRVNEKLEHGI